MIRKKGGSGSKEGESGGREQTLPWDWCAWLQWLPVALKGARSPDGVASRSTWLHCDHLCCPVEKPFYLFSLVRDVHGPESRTW